MCIGHKSSDSSLASKRFGLEIGNWGRTFEAWKGCNDCSLVVLISYIYLRTPIRVGSGFRNQQGTVSSIWRQKRNEGLACRPQEEWCYDSQSSVMYLRLVSPVLCLILNFKARLCFRFPCSSDEAIQMKYSFIKCIWSSIYREICPSQKEIQGTEYYRENGRSFLRFFCNSIQIEILRIPKGARIYKGNKFLLTLRYFGVRVLFINADSLADDSTGRCRYLVLKLTIKTGVY